MFERFLVPSVAVLLGLMSATAAPAEARDIGARIYTQLWDPRNPTSDHVQTIYNDDSIISKSIGKAWHDDKGFLKAGIWLALSQYKVANGVSIYGTATNINDMSDCRLSPAGANTAKLQFLVPATSLDLYVAPKATSEIDKYTANLASAVFNPEFTVTFDLLVQVDLALTAEGGQALKASGVHAIVQHVQVAPKNDAAKALNMINDLSDFVGGPNFVHALEDKINNTDLGNQSITDSMNKGFQALNGPYQQARQAGLNIPTTIWADSNRLTMYFQPPSLSSVPTDGNLTGDIYWNPQTFPSAKPSSFDVTAQVQVGPRPLISSDGEGYGDPPMLDVGMFRAYPNYSSAGPAGALNPSAMVHCDYTMAAVPQYWPVTLSASSNAAPVGAVGSDNPYVGSLHTVAVMLPIDWTAPTVVANANHINYELIKGMAGSQPIGNPHSVSPGQENEQWPQTIVDPGESVSQIWQLPNAGYSYASVGGYSQISSDGRNHHSDQGQTSTGNTPFPWGHQNNAQGAAAPDNKASSFSWNRLKQNMHASASDKVELNPQPLPPRVSRSDFGQSETRDYRSAGLKMRNQQFSPLTAQTRGLRNMFGY